jgi:hypothetical protein
VAVAHGEESANITDECGGAERIDQVAEAALRGGHERRPQALASAAEFFRI